MNKKKAFPVFSKRHPYLLCVVSILFCLVLLTGATFAWYSDSITSSGNRIQAGNLHVSLTMGTLNEGGTDLASENVVDLSDDANKIFSESAFGPGMTGTRYLKVTNQGTMPLRYRAQFSRNGDEFFSGALNFTLKRIVTNGLKEETPQLQERDGTNISTINLMESSRLEADDYDLYELTYSLPENVSNDCNSPESVYFDMDLFLEAQQVNAPN